MKTTCGTLFLDGNEVHSTLDFEATPNVSTEVSEVQKIINRPLYIGNVSFKQAVLKPLATISYEEYMRLCEICSPVVNLFNQLRRHRKARINKKWAKRYGYGRW